MGGGLLKYNTDTLLGLGGQLNQFQFLLDYFVHISHTLAIDLPGCGDSKFGPRDWHAYTTESLCKLIAVIVEQHRQGDQKVVLIGHSMGAALAATLATNGGLLHRECAGVVAICPKAELEDQEKRKLAAAVRLGDVGFDFLRLIDGWGGIDSNSVSRFVGAHAPTSVKKMQLLFNRQSRTPVWRRMAKGMQLPTPEQWANIDCPVYLLGAAEDTVSPVSELDKIYGWLSNRGGAPENEGAADQRTAPAPVVKRCVVPNAGHSVILESHHVVNGLVNDFLSHHVDEVLSLAWQLSFLKEDKWLLKNLEKWSKIRSVSPRIQQTPFRAMKVNFNT